MCERSKTPFAANVVPEWIKVSRIFWETAMKKTESPPVAEAGRPPEGEHDHPMDSMGAFLKQWQSLSAAFTDSQAANAVFQVISSLPEFIASLAKTGWDSAAFLQEQAVEKAGKIGQKTEAYTFENFDQEIFKAWREVYEAEIQQYFKVPPLGLMRFYQEHFNRLLDQCNLAQVSLNEFMFILYQPLEKSFRVLQDQIEQMSQKGALPDKPRDYYIQWLEVLEGHYMNLLKSPEFLRVLRETLNRLEAYSKAKSQFLQDVLQALPVPTDKDMDDVYKELYLLKKKVKLLEKRLDRELCRKNYNASGE